MSKNTLKEKLLKPLSLLSQNEDDITISQVRGFVRQILG
jgi:deoxyribodipyrimidine photolyase-like uncharacterized protein